MATIRGGVVPITISYRKVTKKPETQRTRCFVGLRGILGNLAIRAIEFVEEICYETTAEVLDAGEQQVVHWALEVDDPWGPNDESSLVAVRLPERPASGAAFEIITVIEKKDESQPQAARTIAPEAVAAIPTSGRQQQQAGIRARMRAQITSESRHTEERQR